MASLSPRLLGDPPNLKKNKKGGEYGLLNKTPVPHQEQKCPFIHYDHAFLITLGAPISNTASSLPSAVLTGPHVWF